MKIAFLADIHGNAVALRAVLQKLQGRVQRYFFLGDMCGYYPFVNECMELWPEPEIQGVKGNHDQVLTNAYANAVSEEYTKKYGSALQRTVRSLHPEYFTKLSNLPNTNSFTADGVKISLYHGAPWNHFEGRIYPDSKEWDKFSELKADVVVLGHTHYPFFKQLSGKLIFNPGSVGQPRDLSAQASYALFDTLTRELCHERVAFDPQLLIEDAKKYCPELPYLVEVLTR